VLHSSGMKKPKEVSRPNKHASFFSDAGLRQIRRVARRLDISVSQFIADSAEAAARKALEKKVA